MAATPCGFSTASITAPRTSTSPACSRCLTSNCAHHPELHLAHLEERMRQGGQWPGTKVLGPDDFQGLVAEAIGRLDVEQARGEVLPFVRNPEALDLWSREFFFDVVRRVRCV